MPLGSGGEFSRQIERALIRCVGCVDPSVGSALAYYVNELRKRVPLFAEGDYRVSVGYSLPHVLVPFQLLGSYFFSIDRLCFDVKLNNPFRSDVRTLFSRKIVVPALSLSLSSFVTLRRWVMGSRELRISCVWNEDDVLAIERGNYSLLNFYYFRSIKSLKAAGSGYLDVLLKDMLILLSFFSLATVRNKLNDFVKLLPFLTIYGTDVSGVEALGVTRCLLKISRASLKSGRRVCIRSLLWGELPVYRIKVDVLANDPLRGGLSVVRNVMVYVPELYLNRLLELCRDDVLLVDAVIMSLFIVGIERFGGLALFNVLAVPLNVIPLSEDSAVVAVLLNYVAASAYSSKLTSEILHRGIDGDLLTSVDIDLSREYFLNRLYNVLRKLGLRLRVSSGSMAIKVRNENLLLSPLNYIYVYLSSFSRESLSSILSKGFMRCYSPYVLLPVLGYVIYRGLSIDLYERLLKKMANILEMRDRGKIKLSDIFADNNVYDVKDISRLMREIRLAWNLYVIRLKYSREVVKYEERGRGCDSQSYS